MSDKNYLEEASQLTVNDLNTIKDSLNYSLIRIEDYNKYPSYEYKQKRLDAINEVRTKVDELIKVMRRKYSTSSNSNSLET